MTDQSHSKPIMTNLLARKSLVIFSPIAMPWMRTLNITSISSIDQSLCWSVTKVSWGTSPAAPQGWSAIRPPMRQLWWKEPTKEWFIWKVQYFQRFREINSSLHLIYNKENNYYGKIFREIDLRMVLHRHYLCIIISEKKSIWMTEFFLQNFREIKTGLLNDGFTKNWQLQFWFHSVHTALYCGNFGISLPRFYRKNSVKLTFY